MNAFDYKIGDVLPIEPRPTQFHSGKYDRWAESHTQLWAIVDIRPYEAKAMNETWQDMVFTIEKIVGPKDLDDQVTLSTYDCFTDAPDPVMHVEVTKSVTYNLGTT